jgi:hypothetical protein
MTDLKLLYSAAIFVVREKAENGNKWFFTSQKTVIFMVGGLLWIR